MANIPEEELEELKEVFDMFDRKGDGKVEKSQVIDIIRSAKVNPLTADVEKIVKDSDIEGSRVDFEIFSSIYAQVKNQPGQATYEDLMEAFKTYDKDNSGSMTAATLRQILVNIGDTLKEDDADIIVAKYEDATSGNILYSNMVKELMAL